VVRYKEGKGRKGKTTGLCFFPVDNTIARNANPVMASLLAGMEDQIMDADYVKEVKPLTWMKAMDQCTKRTKEKVPASSFLHLEEVVDICKECGLDGSNILDDYSPTSKLL
jgi:hypothetical protein